MNTVLDYIRDFEETFIFCQQGDLAFPMDLKHILRMEKWQNEFGHMAILFAELDVDPVVFSSSYCDENIIMALELFSRGYVGYRKLVNLMNELDERKNMWRLNEISFGDDIHKCSSHASTGDENTARIDIGV